MKLLALAALVILLARSGYWTESAFLSWPLVWVAARKTTVRANGRQMVATGTRRLVRGTW